MARKETIVTNGPIGQWVAKTNKMSNYIGDLDNLDSAFDSAGADSNIVSAINFIYEKVDSAYDMIFGDSAGTIKVGSIVADSATFRILRAGMMLADSADVDSAWIRDLTVSGRLIVDSAHFNNLHVNNITMDSGEFLTIDSATINDLHANNLTADSAEVNRLRATHLHADSATIDSATIDHLYVQKFNIDGVELDHVKKFTVKLENGSIALSGYFLSTDSDLSIA